ncbi:MAG: nucleoside monophosphate kinase [Patescibacteria group bacterium]|nr:nucleoside monophosphate kinase [Patescibacteria group bacterium]
MNLAIIGPSGSGKGTQAELLAQKYHLAHISTGELFRREYEKKSPEGLAAYKYWSTGCWVPDRETFNLLKLYLDKAKSGFILDGFPRTGAQAEILDDYLSKKGEKLDLVLLFIVSEEEVVKRLLLRAEKDKQEKGKARSDEKEDIIRQRMRSFTQSINPILEYYQKSNRLIKVNGEGKIEDIFSEITSDLSSSGLTRGSI